MVDETSHEKRMGLDVGDHWKKAIDNPIKKRTKKNGKLWVAVLIAFGTLWLVVYMYNGERINAAFKSAYKKTLLYLLGQEMELPDTSPIAFERNKFVKEAKRYLNVKENKTDFYWWHYEDYEVLHESTGLTLKETEHLKFQNPFIVYMYLEERTGYFNTCVTYKEHIYDIRGAYKIQDYTEEDTELDFGQGSWASFVYEYEENQQAYFIQNIGFDEYQVYFACNDVLYELTVPDTEENIAVAKELILEMSVN